MPESKPVADAAGDTIASLRRHATAGESRNDSMDGAIETALLAVWLVRSDQVVLAVERAELERSLDALFELGASRSRALVASALSLGDAELPTPEALVRRLASRSPEIRSRVVEALLAVAAADGSVHRKELALVRHLADRIDLPADAFQSLLRRHGAIEGVRRVQELRIPLDSGVVSIGRGGDNTVQLPSLSVSTHHARFVAEDGDWIVEDLGSATGTYVDGDPVRSRRLTGSSLVRVENFCFRLDPEGGRLTLWNENDLLALSADGIGVEVRDRRTGQPRTILRDVSFTCFSGELIGITGPSGSGKTTLIESLVGLAEGSRGTIRLNGRVQPNLLAHDVRRLGLVPQDDIVHGELTVEESLFFSGALRAVPGVGRSELRAEVDRVVEQLSLGRIRSARIGDSVRRGISGGERKRVNLGQELLNPSTEILILDEPTTGLDPHTGMDIFRLLRRLADEGRVVLVVTHRIDIDTLGLMDRLLVLGNGGRLSYFGAPRDAFRHFGVDSVASMFDQVRDPERAARLADSLRSPESEDPDPGSAEVAEREPERSAPKSRSAWSDLRQWFRQYGLQTVRYGRTKLRDRTAMAINFGQIPLIVLGCWAVLSRSLVVGNPETADALRVVPASLPFVLVISAFWLGCVSAVRELVGEQAIRRRERLVGVRTGAYLLSKISILGLVTILQCLLLVAFTEVFFHLRARHVALDELLAVLFLVGLVGVGLGLCASVVFRTSEAAVAMLPILVIPQLLFGGVLAPIDSMPAPGRLLSRAMVSRWGVEGFVRAGETTWARNGVAIPAKSTVFTIPATHSQACIGRFLSSLGMAPPQGIKAASRKAEGIRESASALLALATLVMFAAFAIARWRDRGTA